jgi:demethylmenaquinone methyltransferase/2-methoxy-6-polyprenyl-1,4-benzoquinol methylase
MPPRAPQPSSKAVESPIPVMPGYFSNDEEKRRFLTGIFDRTAPDYDRMERLLGLGSGSWYRRQALVRAGLVQGMSVVDVAVGTGLVAREAARIAGDPTLVVGVDPSPGMLESAKVPPGVRLMRGKAEEIPLLDASFDFLSMGYALRHISDLSIAFREFHRVLRPGGRVCILEITAPRSRLSRFLLKAYMRGIVPTLGRLFARSNATAELWRYYWDTIEACVPVEAVIATLASCGFREARAVVSYGIFSEYQAIKA